MKLNIPMISSQLPLEKVLVSLTFACFRFPNGTIFHKMNKNTRNIFSWGIFPVINLTDKIKYSSICNPCFHKNTRNIFSREGFSCYKFDR